MRDTIIYNQLCKNLGNTPTEDQSDALKKIAAYICDNNNDVIFLMTGYAGTGKTSVISSVVKTLDLLRMRSVLLAPTGRAAKVLSSYSGKQAFTVRSPPGMVSETFLSTAIFIRTLFLLSMKHLWSQTVLAIPRFLVVAGYSTI
jgi:hypothetical protein